MHVVCGICLLHVIYYRHVSTAVAVIISVIYNSTSPNVVEALSCKPEGGGFDSRWRYGTVTLG